MLLASKQLEMEPGLGDWEIAGCCQIARTIRSADALVSEGLIKYPTPPIPASFYGDRHNLPTETL